MWALLWQVPQQLPRELLTSSSQRCVCLCNARFQAPLVSSSSSLSPHPSSSTLLSAFSSSAPAASFSSSCCCSAFLFPCPSSSTLQPAFYSSSSFSFLSITLSSPSCTHLLCAGGHQHNHHRHQEQPSFLCSSSSVFPSSSYERHPLLLSVHLLLGAGGHQHNHHCNQE